MPLTTCCRCTTSQFPTAKWRRQRGVVFTFSVVVTIVISVVVTVDINVVVIDTTTSC